MKYIKTLVYKLEVNYFIVRLSFQMITEKLNKKGYNGYA